jgi:hypothetical protein
MTELDIAKTVALAMVAVSTIGLLLILSPER